MFLMAEPGFAPAPKAASATPFSGGVEHGQSAGRVEAAQPAPAENAAPAEDPALEKARREQAFLVTAAKSFVEKSESRLSGMRQIVCSLHAEANESAKTQAFLNLSRIAHVMGSNAAVVGMHYLAHLATAFEALAWELFEKPSQFRLPTQKTLAKAIDTMARLIASGSSFQLKEFRRFNVLVVDDHRIARTMINRALDRANLSHVSIGQPEIALELLKENEFELVILDVKMDGISGVDLCTALRKIPHQKQSRVLFVSAMKDIQTRVASIQAGGNDYIVKPFVPMELAVNVLLHMIDLQLSQAPAEQPGKPAAKSA
jgi:PleD family two-component response regulator